MYFFQKKTGKKLFLCRKEPGKRTKKSADRLERTFLNRFEYNAISGRNTQPRGELQPAQGSHRAWVHVPV